MKARLTWEKTKDGYRSAFGPFFLVVEYSDNNRSSYIAYIDVAKGCKWTRDRTYNSADGAKKAIRDLLYEIYFAYDRMWEKQNGF